jgi:hypothetical protein
LGEPIGIERRGGSLVVSGTGLTSERREEIQRALAHLEFIEFRFYEPEPIARESAVQPEVHTGQAVEEVRSAVESRLAGRTTFNEYADQVLDASNAVLARGHALRSLAERFPGETERELPPAEQAVLESLRRSHAERLHQALGRLDDLLREGFGFAAREDARTRVDGQWQARAPGLLAAAQELDTAATAILAGGNTARAGALEHALARLCAEEAMFRSAP